VSARCRPTAAHPLSDSRHRTTIEVQAAHHVATTRPFLPHRGTLLHQLPTTTLPRSAAWNSYPPRSTSPDGLPARTHDRVQCDHVCHSTQDSPSKLLVSLGQPTSLIVCQQEPSSARPWLQHVVRLELEPVRPPLIATTPPGDDHENGAQRQAACARPCMLTGPTVSRGRGLPDGTVRAMRCRQNETPALETRLLQSPRGVDPCLGQLEPVLIDDRCQM